MICECSETPCRLPAVAVVCSGHWAIASDRIGPVVLARLAGRYGAGVEVHDIGTTALALLERLDRQDLMLIVDACKMGGRPGSVQIVEPDFEALLPTMAGLHQIGPVETLLVARQLYPHLLPKSLYLILVETEGLRQAALEPAAEEVIAVIDQEVERLFGDASFR